MARLGGFGDERAAVDVRKDHPAVQGADLQGVLHVLARYGLSASPEQLEDLGWAYRFTIVDPAMLLRDSWWSEVREPGVIIRWARPRAIGPPDRAALLAQVRAFRATLERMPKRNPKEPYQYVLPYPKLGSPVIFAPERHPHPYVPAGAIGQVLPPLRTGRSPYVYVGWPHGACEVLGTDLQPAISLVRRPNTEHLPVGARVRIKRLGISATVVPYWAGDDWDPGAAGLVPVLADDGIARLVRADDAKRLDPHANSR